MSDNPANRLVQRFLCPSCKGGFIEQQPDRPTHGRCGKCRALFLLQHVPGWDAAAHGAEYGDE